MRLAALPLSAQGQRATSSLAPDLVEVIDAWDQLPEAVRAGIVAMIQAATGRTKKPREAQD